MGWGVPSRVHSRSRGPLTLELTLLPAKSQPQEEKGEQADAISQANGNLSNHLDKTVLEFIQFPLPEGDCAPPASPADSVGCTALS